jgi:hypothetical protein
VSAIYYGIKKNGGLPSVKYVYREGNPPPAAKKKKKKKKRGGKNNTGWSNYKIDGINIGYIYAYRVNTLLWY